MVYSSGITVIEYKQCQFHVVWLLEPNEGEKMTGKIVPFGYAAKGAEERLAEPMQDENMMLMDIRLKPVSRWRPVWNRGALSAAWKRRYFWVGFKLGNKNYNNDLPIELVDPSGVSSVIELLRQDQHVVLLCACKHYEKCHRKVVTELVQQQLPEVEIDNE